MFCSSINIADLHYRPMQANRSGGKTVPVSTKADSDSWDHNLRFQMSEDNNTNLQNAVWGLSTPLPGQDGTRRALELTIESPTLKKFLEGLDARNVKEGCEHATEWFKPPATAETVPTMYSPILKPDNAETVRVKVKCGERPTNVYIVHGTSPTGELQYEKGTHNDLTRNAKCLVMVETTGLWFMSRQYGMSLVATDIMVWPSKPVTGIEAFTMSNVNKLSQVAPVSQPCIDMAD